MYYHTDDMLLLEKIMQDAGYKYIVLKIKKCMFRCLKALKNLAQVKIMSGAVQI